MPIYIYRCKSCGVQFERHQSFTDEPLKRCPECSKNSLRKVLTPAGIVFKGSGWYATDNKSASGASRHVMNDSKESGSEKSESASSSSSSEASSKSESASKSESSNKSESSGNSSSSENKSSSGKSENPGGSSGKSESSSKSKE